MLTALALYGLLPSLHPLALNLGAFCGAFGVSYVGHSYFTFRTGGKIGRFIVAALAGLAANNLCLAISLWAGLPAVPAIWAATLAAPLVVFLISKFWVFAADA
jgi:hypothetical protein